MVFEHQKLFSFASLNLFNFCLFEFVNWAIISGYVFLISIWSFVSFSLLNIQKNKDIKYFSEKSHYLTHLLFVINPIHPLSPSPSLFPTVMYCKCVGQCNKWAFLYVNKSIPKAITPNWQRHYPGALGR